MSESIDTKSAIYGFIFIVGAVVVGYTLIKVASRLLANGTTNDGVGGGEQQVMASPPSVQKVMSGSSIPMF